MRYPAAPAWIGDRPWPDRPDRGRPERGTRCATVEQAEIFVALLVAVILAALAVRRVERVPYAVALVVGGIVAGLFPFAPEVRLDPEVIFVAFLPPILYPSAFTFAF